MTLREHLASSSELHGVIWPSVDWYQMVPPNLQNASDEMASCINQFAEWAALGPELSLRSVWSSFDCFGFTDMSTPQEMPWLAVMLIASDFAYSLGVFDENVTTWLEFHLQHIAELDADKRLKLVETTFCYSELRGYVNRHLDVVKF